MPTKSQNKALEDKLFYFGGSLVIIAPIISFILFIGSLLLKYKKYSLRTFSRNLNKGLVYLTLFMVITCIFNIFFPSKLLTSGWDPANVWLSLMNWVPFFIFIYFIKIFLKEKKNRKFFLISLLIGSAPALVIVGLLQFLEIAKGEINFFNGLIRWFPYYREYINLGNAINPIFKNSNYSATAILICWIPSLSLAIQNSINITKKILLINLLLGIFITILLTKSSVAFLCICLSIPIFFGFERYKLYLMMASFLGIFVLFISLIQEDFFFREFNIVNILSTLDARIQIWKESLEYIVQKPLFGWGGGSFPILVSEKDGYQIFHSHNIFLELAFNFGIPCSLIMMNYLIINPIKTYLIILKNNTKKIFSNQDIVWVSTTILLIISQLFDITIYDGRLNLCLWIFLAGCIEIEREQHKKYKN